MKSIHKKTKARSSGWSPIAIQSQRETHITELGKYIEVDSTFDPQSIMWSTLRFIQFLPKVLRNARVNLQVYKFYFSFENVICSDNVKNSSKLVNIQFPSSTVGPIMPDTRRPIFTSTPASLNEMRFGCFYVSIFQLFISSDKLFNRRSSVKFLENSSQSKKTICIILQNYIKKGD